MSGSLSGLVDVLLDVLVILLGLLSTSKEQPQSDGSGQDVSSRLLLRVQSTVDRLELCLRVLALGELDEFVQSITQPTEGGQGDRAEQVGKGRKGVHGIFGGFDDGVGRGGLDAVGSDGLVQGMTSGVLGRIDGHDLGRGGFHLGGGRERIFGLALKVVRLKGLQRMEGMGEYGFSYVALDP